MEVSTYAKKGDNAVLKSFAQQTLPALEDLFKHVHTLKAGSAPRRASSAISMTATTTPMRAPTPGTGACFRQRRGRGVNDVEASAQRPAAGRGGSSPPSPKGGTPLGSGSVPELNRTAPQAIPTARPPSTQASTLARPELYPTLRVASSLGGTHASSRT